MLIACRRMAAGVTEVLSWALLGLENGSGEVEERV
jgi:hypothetical protein